MKLNTLTLPYSDWSGKYLTEEPITLQAQPKTGYSFAGWEVTGATFLSGSATSAAATIQPSGANVTITAKYTAAGSYSKADVQKLLRFLLASGSLTEQEAQSYDMDSNGKLNAKDLTLLKRFVMG